MNRGIVIAILLLLISLTFVDAKWLRKRHRKHGLALRSDTDIDEENDDVEENIKEDEGQPEDSSHVAGNHGHSHSYRNSGKTKTTLAPAPPFRRKRKHEGNHNRKGHKHSTTPTITPTFSTTTSSTEITSTTTTTSTSTQAPTTRRKRHRNKKMKDGRYMISNVVRWRKRKSSKGRKILSSSSHELCNFRGNYGISGSCDRYNQCRKPGRQPIRTFCPNGKRFDLIKRQCVNKREARCYNEAICPSDSSGTQYAAEPRDSSYFLECRDGVPIPVKCEMGEQYNEHSKGCV